MPRQSWKAIGSAVALVAVAATVLYWFVFLRREHTRWTETIECPDGTTVKAKFEHSARVYWGLSHMGGFGGGDDRTQAEIEVAGKRYTWTGGDERPIAIGLRGGKLFMAVFDRTIAACRYRYYRSGSEDRLLEIPRGEFPRELAVQNAWLNEDARKLLKSMDPEDGWFQRSLTARMWVHVESGVDYWESDVEDKAPTPQFIAEYKRRYLMAGPATRMHKPGN